MILLRLLMKVTKDHSGWYCSSILTKQGNGDNIELHTRDTDDEGDNRRF